MIRGRREERIEREVCGRAVLCRRFSRSAGPPSSSQTHSDQHPMLAFASLASCILRRPRLQQNPTAWDVTAADFPGSPRIAENSLAGFGGSVHSSWHLDVESTAE